MAAFAAVISGCSHPSSNSTDNSDAAISGVMRAKARAAETAFYLAPLNHRDPLQDDTRVLVQANGNATFKIANIFKAAKNYMAFDLHYDSGGYGDGGSPLSGWRSSFSSHMDAVPGYDGFV